MPKLNIFDDDNDKIDVAKGVIEALKRIDPSWEIGYATRLPEDSLGAITALKEARGSLCVVDVEILANNFTTPSFSDSIAMYESQLMLGADDQSNRLKEYYTALFGSEDNYKWAVHAFAYTALRRIPTIVISTKSHQDTLVSISESAAVQGGLTTLSQWRPEILAPSAAGAAERAYEAIAKRIHGEWVKWCGKIDGRIWGAPDRHQGTKQGWFKRSAPTEHPHMKHDLPSSPTPVYLSNMRGFLDSIINKNKAAPIDFSKYPITERCHEAVKALVGDVSNADFATFADKVPELNTVALLAAAWDPNAASWFPSFQWAATHPLMVNTATKTQLREAILTIGGEGRLFESKLIDKFNNLPNADDQWEPSQSFVEKVTATKTSVTIEFKAKLRKLEENFNNAKLGEPWTGGNCAHLLAAWQSLKTSDGRTVDMFIEDNRLTFSEFTQP